VAKLKWNALLSKALLDTNYYFLAQVGTKLLGLLIIPFLVRILSVEEFAHYDIFLMASSLLTTIVVLGIDSGISIMIADHKENESLINYLFSFSLLLSVLAVLVVWSISVFIFPYIETAGSIIQYIHYLFIYILFNLISYQVFNFIRWIGKAGAASVIGFISYAVGVVLGFCMIYFNPNPELIDYLYGVILGNFIGAIASLVISYKHLSFKWIPEYRKYLKELMKVSLPFVPNYIAANIMMMTDRLVIVSILGEKSLGIYALANRFAQIPNFGINIITRGFQPVMYLNYKEVNGISLIKKVYDYSHYALLIFVPIMYFLATPIVVFFGGIKYYDAIPLIPIITLSAMVYGIMGLNGMGYTIQRKTYLITIISLLSIFLNTAFNFLLGKQFGIVGIAVGVLIVSCIISFLYTYLSEKLYSFNFNLKASALIYTLVILTTTFLIIYF
jgi:O-antigen/teichoic acid export membrane protein